MSWIIALIRKVVAAVRREQHDRDLRDELALHLDLEAEAQARRGLPADAARRAAVQRFGGVDAVTEAYRDSQRVASVENLIRDLRHAVRSLRAAPTFSLAVIATLALGIGANTAMFSVVRGVLLRALPYRDAERIVAVWGTDPKNGGSRELTSSPDYIDFARRSRSWSALAAVSQGSATLTDGEPVRISAASATPNVMTVLGVTPLIGRGFTADDVDPSATPVALLGERLWRSRYGGRADILGRTIQIETQLVRVVGVLPARVQFPTDGIEAWVASPLEFPATTRGRHSLTVVGRLRDGVSLAAARRDMAGVAKQLEAEFPAVDAGRGVSLEPLPEALFGGVRRGLLVLLGAVGIVLLIACANAACLFMARLASRSREIAVRAALGASRGRLAQQLFVEGLVLSVLGGALGCLLAVGGLRGLAEILPATLPRRDEIAVDASVLGVTLAVSLVVATVFSLLPLGATASVNAQGLVGAGTRGGTASREYHRARRALVVGEIALALTLVVMAGLVVQSFRNLRGVDPGFSDQNVLIVQYQLPAARYPQRMAEYPAGWTKILAFQDELVARVSSLPGVRSAAVAVSDPLTPAWTNRFTVEGRPPSAANDGAELANRPVGASYFATVGIPLLSGRALGSTDIVGTPPVLLINDAAAKKYFPNENPVGKRIVYWGAAREIVGVVGNERFTGLTVEVPAAMYPVLSQAPSPNGTLLVATRGDARAVRAGVERVIHELDPRIAAFGVRTLDEATAALAAPQRFSATLFGAFAGLALTLALVGIYGVIAYSVTQRRREIGIRTALGAGASAIFREIIGDGMRLAAFGCAIGAVGALIGGRLVASQLFGVAAGDVTTLVLSIVAILAVAAIGSILPAHRATRVAPIVALRVD